MNSKPFLRILNAFSPSPCAFTVKELLSAMDPALLNIVRTLRSNRHRLLKISSVSDDDTRFMMDSTLFRWFVDLNIRLAKAAQFRLKERQLAVLTSEMRITGVWQSPPVEIVQWGENLGLISQCYTSCDYVFPLARVLAGLPDSACAYATRILSDLAKNETWRENLKQRRNDYLDTGFSQYSDRTAYIVAARQGFLNKRAVSVAQLAKQFRVTTARIGQIENSFYHRLEKQGIKLRKPFLHAMLHHYLKESGHMVVDRNSMDISVWPFLCRACKIPYAELQEIKMLIPGVSSENVASIGTQPAIPEEYTEQGVASQLESIEKLCLVKVDMQLLANRIAQHRQRHTKLEDRVCLVLRAIGHPAHFTRIMEKHNELFPAYPATESAILGKLIQKKGGVVWIGIRGTYALREWGYETPSKSLFETIADIVKRIYALSGRPVPLTVIQAELGKHRKVVKLSSLILATQCNPKLRCVTKDTYLPREPDDVSDDELTVDQIDKLIRESKGRISGTDEESD